MSKFLNVFPNVVPRDAVILGLYEAGPWLSDLFHNAGRFDLVVNLPCDVDTLSGE